MSKKPEYIENEVYAAVKAECAGYYVRKKVIESQKYRSARPLLVSTYREANRMHDECLRSSLGDGQRRLAEILRYDIAYGIGYYRSEAFAFCSRNFYEKAKRKVTMSLAGMIGYKNL